MSLFKEQFPDYPFRPVPATPIRLSREGVFPIAGKAATGLACSGTIQGEGKLCGTPSLFVRLQGCNLRCVWQTAQTAAGGTKCLCDTAHTWDQEGGSPSTVKEVVEVIDRNMGQMRHVVITGGEPYLQPRALLDLLTALNELRIHTTVETNGTIADSEIVRQTRLTSISPKLTSSGIGDTMRRQTIEATEKNVLDACEAGLDAQLKFVVSQLSDADEIERDYGHILGLMNTEDIFVMPLGATPQMLAQTSKAALQMAVERGWRYGPRLHIDLFGNKEGT